MNLFLHIKHKQKLAALLFVIVLIEIFNSYSYNNNISKMGTSFSEVYSDRVLAQDYIYKISEKIHERQFIISSNRLSNDSLIKYLEINFSEINQLTNDYEKTQFVANEKIIFTNLKANILLMHQNQLHFFNSKNQIEKNYYTALNEKKMANSFLLLHELSEIQINISKNLNENSQKIVSFSNLSSKLDWALIIIIGIIIQALIFASKSTIPKFSQNQHLN